MLSQESNCNATRQSTRIFAKRLNADIIKAHLDATDSESDGKHINKRPSHVRINSGLTEEDCITSDADEFCSDSDSSGVKYDKKNFSHNKTWNTPSQTDGQHQVGSWQGPRKWSPDEDDRLRRAVEARGESHWKSIAAEVGSRNHVQCLQRWKKVLRPGLRKGCWTSDEDTMLARLVARGGFKNWGVLASHMIGRTSKQCRERWQHHLDPAIKRTAYTLEEDAAVLLGHARLGNRWSQIAMSIPGRTENSIKARFQLLHRQGHDTDTVSSVSSSPAYLSRSLDFHPKHRNSGISNHSSKKMYSPNIKVSAPCTETGMEVCISESPKVNMDNVDKSSFQNASSTCKQEPTLQSGIQPDLATSKILPWHSNSRQWKQPSMDVWESFLKEQIALTERKNKNPMNINWEHLALDPFFGLPTGSTFQQSSHPLQHSLQSIASQQNNANFHQQLLQWQAPHASEEFMVNSESTDISELGMFDEMDLAMALCLVAEDNNEANRLLCGTDVASFHYDAPNLATFSGF